MKKLFQKLTLLNAAEATVISFLLMSLIGGSILWFTENQRFVNAKTPVLQTMTISPVSNDPLADSTGIPYQQRTEIHTTTKDLKYQGESYVDSIFIAVSALCVTGLSSTDFTQFTPAGQVVVLILIQMGGLGIIVFTSIFAFVIARGLSERTSFHSFLANILDTDKTDVLRMLKHIITYTLLFEGTAALIMGGYLQWFVAPAVYNNLNPWWWGVFHAVSGFNNAGFGLMNNNLVSFAMDPVINIIIALLIILGGLGYPVLIGLHAGLRKKTVHKHDQTQKRLETDVQGVVASPVQTRVAIFGTIILLILGTLIPLLLEADNPALGSGFWNRLLAAFFQSVSTRTAGFNTIDVGALHVATVFLYMLLMFIGANPAGTAGGIKIPTLGVLYGYIKDWFKKPNQPVTLFKRRISKFAVSHAIRLFFFSILFISIITFLICVAESKYMITPDPTFNFTKVLFEVFSAFGTVGLTMGFPGGVTSFSAILTPISKLLLVATMLFGRLGPLTILASLPWKRKYSQEPLSPDFENTEKIQIG